MTELHFSHGHQVRLPTDRIRKDPSFYFTKCHGWDTNLYQKRLAQRAVLNLQSEEFKLWMIETLLTSLLNFARLFWNQRSTYILELKAFICNIDLTISSKKREGKRTFSSGKPVMLATSCLLPLEMYWLSMKLF
nr:hypothetical transcript [Hymenolepis microstoma]